MTAKTATKAKKPSLNLDRVFPWLITLLGTLGLLASFTLMVDKIHVLKDPSFRPNCNINPILSCGSVMVQPQADLFGIPNTLFGVIAFTVIVTVGVTLLFGAKFPKLFWQLFQAGALAGLLGVIYLFYQGIYVIGAICPWCALTWAVVIAINLYLRVYNLRVGNAAVPKRFKKFNDFLQREHLGVLFLIYLAIVALLLNHFWYYFGR